MFTLGVESSVHLYLSRTCTRIPPSGGHSTAPDEELPLVQACISVSTILLISLPPSLGAGIAQSV
jgi:hypothetical protein